MEKTERKWSARITDGRTIGRKCAFVVGLHNDSAYEDCIASIELNHKEDADGWFEKYFKIAECMNAHSELQAKASAYDRLIEKLSLWGKHLKSASMAQNSFDFIYCAQQVMDEITLTLPDGWEEK